MLGSICHCDRTKSACLYKNYNRFLIEINMVQIHEWPVSYTTIESFNFERQLSVCPTTK